MQRLTAAPQQRAERLRDSCVPWPRRGHNRTRRGDEVGLHKAPTGGLARGRAREHVQERRSTARASELADETGCLLQALRAQAAGSVNSSAVRCNYTVNRNYSLVTNCQFRKLITSSTLFRTVWL